MTHEDEITFQDRVYEYLAQNYGSENVETDKYLPEPYRFVDVWIDGPVAPLAIEIENDFEAVMEGVGQALIYAASAENAIPVVIVPPGHVEEPEVTALRRRIPVVELDV